MLCGWRMMRRRRKSWLKRTLSASLQKKGEDEPKGDKNPNTLFINLCTPPPSQNKLKNQERYSLPRTWSGLDCPLAVGWECCGPWVSEEHRAPPPPPTHSALLRLKLHLTPTTPTPATKSSPLLSSTALDWHVFTNHKRGFSTVQNRKWNTWILFLGCFLWL